MQWRVLLRGEIKYRNIVLIQQGCCFRHFRSLVEDVSPYYCAGSSMWKRASLLLIMHSSCNISNAKRIFTFTIRGFVIKSQYLALMISLAFHNAAQY